MANETAKPKLSVVAEELDEDEREFQKLRRDLPGVKGASAIGIVSITVSKKPPKNEFFRTNKDFLPTVKIVDLEVGTERQFFAVTDDMVVALAGIGITVTDHRLYLIVSPEGAVRIVPINVESENDYDHTRERGLIQGMDEWVRLYTDHRCSVPPSLDSLLRRHERSPIERQGKSTSDSIGDVVMPTGTMRY
jgi:hypothetical protein